MSESNVEVRQKPNSQLQHYKRQQKQQQQNCKLEWSKQLTIVDIGAWAIITLLLLIVMFVDPTLAQYCVNIFTTATAAYVSLRLGYTAKAGVENYVKIKKAYTEINSNSDDLQENG